MLRPILNKSCKSTGTIRNFSSDRINLSKSTINYNSPISKGKIIAYDEALNYLKKDQESRSEELQELKLKGKVDHEVLERIEIESFINDPEIRWRAKNGLGDKAQPIYRELAERKWRKDGELAILMQRVTQMSIIPDLIPIINPTAELKIVIDNTELIPGVFVLPEQTQDGFKVEASVYHSETRLYSLLLIDPDVPDELNHSFTTFAHWLIPNIPLSSTISTITSPALLPFIPPHPQFGTPYHRYTLFLLAQPLNSSTNTYTSINLVEEALEREGMNVREFMNSHGLEAVGVNFFRQKWNDSVGTIFKKAFNGEEEKRFGPVKNVKRTQYKEIEGMKGRSKYSLE